MSNPVIHLDPIAPHHAPDVQRLASDPAIGATSNVPSPYPEDGAEIWINSELRKREQGQSYAFAVRNKSDQLVGVVTLMNVNREAGTAELGYWIGKPHWGQGYATAAACACVQYAQQELGITCIRATSLEENTASRRVLEKAGFHPMGSGETDERGPTLKYEWRASPPEESV